MSHWIRICAVALALLGMTSLSTISEAAANYPRKPITLVCCYAPGGDGDLSARLWAEFAEKRLGQPVLVVNKTGGGGVTGTTFAAMAPADGYTLYLAQQGPVLVTPYIANTKFNFDSFAYIARITIGNCGLVVRADAPWNTLEEFFKDVKANPGKFSFASPGATTWLSFAMRHLNTSNNINVKQVEFQGSAPAVTAVMGGHATYTFVFPQNYVSQIKAGQLKLLALGEKEKDFPNVRTFEEQGYKGNYYGWAGIAAPKGTPADIVNILSKVTQEVVQDPAFAEKARNINAVPAFLGTGEWAPVLQRQASEMQNMLKDTPLK